MTVTAYAVARSANVPSNCRFTFNLKMEENEKHKLISGDFFLHDMNVYILKAPYYAHL